MLQISPEREQKLYQAILSLKNEEECAAFVKDIFTVQEIEALVQRIEVAALLSQGKSYMDVNKLTCASTATICRVSRCLQYGSGGYKTVLSRMEEQP